jgi:acyl dehydratase
MTKTISQFQPGEKFITKSRFVTATDVDTFARITGYDDLMFLDEEHAKSKGWKTRIVQGGLVFSMSIGLLENSGLIDDVIAYLGTDNLKFPAPVYPHDILTVDGELLDKRITKDGERGIIHYKWITKNQKGETVVEGVNTCMFKVHESY